MVTPLEIVGEARAGTRRAKERVGETIEASGEIPGDLSVTRTVGKLRQSEQTLFDTDTGQMTRRAGGNQPLLINSANAVADETNKKATRRVLIHEGARRWINSWVERQKGEDPSNPLGVIRSAIRRRRSRRQATTTGALTPQQLNEQEVKLYAQGVIELIRLTDPELADELSEPSHLLNDINDPVAVVMAQRHNDKNVVERILTDVLGADAGRDRAALQRAAANLFAIYQPYIEDRQNHPELKQTPVNFAPQKNLWETSNVVAFFPVPSFGGTRNQPLSNYVPPTPPTNPAGYPGSGMLDFLDRGEFPLFGMGYPGNNVVEAVTRSGVTPLDGYKHTTDSFYNKVVKNIGSGNAPFHGVYLFDSRLITDPEGLMRLFDSPDGHLPVSGLSPAAVLQHTLEHEPKHLVAFSQRLRSNLGYTEAEWAERLGRQFEFGTGELEDSRFGDPILGENPDHVYGPIDLFRDARSGTFIRRQVDELMIALRHPDYEGVVLPDGLRGWSRTDPVLSAPQRIALLWKFYANNISWDRSEAAKVQSLYALKAGKQAAAQLVAEIDESLKRRGFDDGVRRILQQAIREDLMYYEDGPLDRRRILGSSSEDVLHQSINEAAIDAEIATRIAAGTPNPDRDQVINDLIAQGRVIPLGSRPDPNRPVTGPLSQHNRLSGQNRLTGKQIVLAQNFVADAYAMSSAIELDAEFNTAIAQPDAAERVKQFIAAYRAIDPNFTDNDFYDVIELMAGRETRYRLQHPNRPSPPRASAAPDRNLIGGPRAQAQQAPPPQAPPPPGGGLGPGGTPPPPGGGGATPPPGGGTPSPATPSPGGGTPSPGGGTPSPGTPSPGGGTPSPGTPAKKPRKKRTPKPKPGAQTPPASPTPGGQTPPASPTPGATPATPNQSPLPQGGSPVPRPRPTTQRPPQAKRTGPKPSSKADTTTVQKARALSVDVVMTIAVGDPNDSQWLQKSLDSLDSDDQAASDHRARAVKKVDKALDDVVAWANGRLLPQPVGIHRHYPIQIVAGPDDNPAVRELRQSTGPKDLLDRMDRLGYIVLDTETAGPELKIHGGAIFHFYAKKRNPDGTVEELDLYIKPTVTPAMPVDRFPDAFETLPDGTRIARLSEELTSGPKKMLDRAEYDKAVSQGIDRTEAAARIAAFLNPDMPVVTMNGNNFDLPLLDEMLDEGRAAGTVDNDFGLIDLASVDLLAIGHNLLQGRHERHDRNRKVSDLARRLYNGDKIPSGPELIGPWMTSKIGSPKGSVEGYNPATADIKEFWSEDGVKHFVETLPDGTKIKGEAMTMLKTNNKLDALANYAGVRARATHDAKVDVGKTEETMRALLEQGEIQGMSKYAFDHEAAAMAQEALGMGPPQGGTLDRKRPGDVRKAKGTAQRLAGGPGTRSSRTDTDLDLEQDERVDAFAPWPDAASRTGMSANPNLQVIEPQDGMTSAEKNEMTALLEKLEGLDQIKQVRKATNLTPEERQRLKILLTKAADAYQKAQTRINNSRKDSVGDEEIRTWLDQLANMEQFMKDNPDLYSEEAIQVMVDGVIGGAGNLTPELLLTMERRVSELVSRLGYQGEFFEDMVSAHLAVALERVVREVRNRNNLLSANEIRELIGMEPDFTPLVAAILERVRLGNAPDSGAMRSANRIAGTRRIDDIAPDSGAMRSTPVVARNPDSSRKTAEKTASILGRAESVGVDIDRQEREVVPRMAQNRKNEILNPQILERNKQDIIQGQNLPDHVDKFVDRAVGEGKTDLEILQDPILKSANSKDSYGKRLGLARRIAIARGDEKLVEQIDEFVDELQRFTPEQYNSALEEAVEKFNSPFDERPVVLVQSPLEIVSSGRYRTVHDGMSSQNNENPMTRGTNVPELRRTAESMTLNIPFEDDEQIRSLRPASAMVAQRTSSEARNAKLREIYGDDVEIMHDGPSIGKEANLEITEGTSAEQKGQGRQYGFSSIILRPETANRTLAVDGDVISDQGESGGRISAAGARLTNLSRKGEIASLFFDPLALLFEERTGRRDTVASVRNSQNKRYVEGMVLGSFEVSDIESVVASPFDLRGRDKIWGFEKMNMPGVTPQASFTNLIAAARQREDLVDRYGIDVVIDSPYLPLDEVEPFNAQMTETWVGRKIANGDWTGVTKSDLIKNRRTTPYEALLRYRKALAEREGTVPFFDHPDNDFRDEPGQVKNFVSMIDEELARIGGFGGVSDSGAMRSARVKMLIQRIKMGQMSVGEAAEQLGVSPSTIYALMRKPAEAVGR